MAGWGGGSPDTTHAFLALWGLSMLRVGIGGFTYGPRSVVTRCAVRTSRETAWLLMPQTTNWWTAAKWRRELRGVTTWCHSVTDILDNQQIEWVAGWPKNVPAIAVWRRTFTSAGPSIIRRTDWHQLLTKR